VYSALFNTNGVGVLVLASEHRVGQALGIRVLKTGVTHGSAGAPGTVLAAFSGGHAFLLRSVGSALRAARERKHIALENRIREAFGIRLLEARIPDSGTLTPYTALPSLSAAIAITCGSI